MSEETIVQARLQEDETIVQVLSDGSEKILESQTDWDRVDAMTDEQIEAAALSDPDCPPSSRAGWFQRLATS
ncbi:MAG: hypothetical protein ACFCU8_05935 [Thermosynechococcaceae cyanobacterium]